MACYHPIHGYRQPSGKIRFPSAGTFTQVEGEISVPCGRCWGCRLDRSRQWAVRIMHETQMHENSCFITLTYNDRHLPPGHTLQKKDWTLFAKKLRNRAGQFRFYMAGEYGEDHGRPHLHAILWGLDFKHDRYYWRTSKKGFQLDRSPQLEKIWGKGFCEIGEVTFASAAYVARYIMKKVNGAPAEKHYEGRLPEFTNMSRDKGIGNSWFKKFGSDVFPRDEVIVNGARCSPPKYYDRLLEAVDPELLVNLKESREIYGKSRAFDNTPARLAKKEGVALFKGKQLKRGLTDVLSTHKMSGDNHTHAGTNTNNKGNLNPFYTIKNLRKKN